MNDESNLIKLLRSGDRHAFDQIFRIYYKPMCVVVSQIVMDRDAVEEVVDDVFLGIWEKREQLPEIRNFGDYLFVTTRNASLNYIRNNGSGSGGRLPWSVVRRFSDIVDKAFVDANNPLDFLLQEQLGEEARKAMAYIPDKSRNVFLKSRMEGKSYQEIARELDISVNTVRYHMKLALRILRKHLSKFLMVLVFFA